MISFGSEDTLIVDPLLQSTAYRAPYSWKMSYHYCTSLRSQAVRFIDSPPNTDIEWLSIMQHHAPDSAAIRLNGKCAVTLAVATQYRSPCPDETVHWAGTKCLASFRTLSRTLFHPLDKLLLGHHHAVFNVQHHVAIKGCTTFHGKDEGQEVRADTQHIGWDERTLRRRGSVHSRGTNRSSSIPRNSTTTTVVVGYMNGRLRIGGWDPAC